MVNKNNNLAAQLEAEMGNRLVQAGVFFVNQHKQRVGKSNPRPHDTPSAPGEYPRKRTGMGQAGVVMHPTDPIVAGKEGRVLIGQMNNTFYMLILERGRDRLGFEDTLADLKPQLKVILEG